MGMGGSTSKPPRLDILNIPKFMTPTNIILPQKNMLVRSALTGSPALAHKLALAGTPAQLRFTPLQEKKTSGMEVRRTLDEKLRFVGFIRFVSFNFGHVQLLKFVIVMVRSYSFSHLDLVK